jgi:protein TonB
MGSPAPDRFVPWSFDLPRAAPIVAAVAGLHAVALWALQGSPAHPAPPVVIPVVIVAERVEPPPAPEVRPEPPPAMIPAPKPPPRPQPRPQPHPVARPAAALSPAPDAPTGAAEPAPPPTSPATLATPAPASPARPAPPVVQLPAYAQGCEPAYPPMSRRMGEQGHVIVRVLIDADGQARRAEIKQSSGFERLDAAARQAVLGCRFAPGTVDGVARTMTRDAPMTFVLH